MSKANTAGRGSCHWCGAPLPDGIYSLASTKPPRKICKDFCRRDRYFDNPNLKSSREYSLTAHPIVFKTGKPVSVLIDGERTTVTSWKDVYKVILQCCIQDPVYHERLLRLMEYMTEQQKSFISASPDNMRNPLEICNGIYVETACDYLTPLGILTEHLLPAIHYDFSNIRIEMDWKEMQDK
jgi:hypothetical protein